MKKTTQVILGIDWGSKYIGLAYMQNSSDVVFPIGYLLNDALLYFSLTDIISRHKVTDIVVGMPAKQKDIQAKIQSFIEKLSITIDTQHITIHTIDEDYSSVQAGELVSNFKKNAASDTVSAMLILERWKKHI